MADTKNPDEKQIEEMVESISDWLSKQPHLPNLEDKKLIRKFLVNCKFRLQQTKNKIENYYSARTKLPSIFQNRDPAAPKTRKSAEVKLFFPMPKPLKNGCKVCVTKFSGDPEDFVPSDFVPRMFMILDVMFLEEDSNLNYIIIVDFRGFSFAHFLKISTVAKQFLDVLQNVMPAGLKGLHFVNVPSFIDKVVVFFKPLFSSKLQARFYVHKGIETLHEQIGERDILPSDLGGKESTIAELNDQWQKKIESYKNWFEKEENIRSNEELRPPNSTNSWLAGTEGSFKKLAVD